MNICKSIKSKHHHTDNSMCSQSENRYRKTYQGKNTSRAKPQKENPL